MKPIRVILADDHHALRRAMVVTLEKDQDIEVIAEAANGAELIGLCQEHLPDVVIVDIRMPVMDGIEACKRLKLLLPQIKQLVLTTFDNDEYLQELFMMGIDGYLLKTSDDVALANAIRSVAMGINTLDRSIVHKMGALLSNSEHKSAALTETEIRIARMITEGFYNKDIATTLEISYGRVRNIVSDIYRKLGVTERADVAQALESLYVREDGGK